MNVNYVDAELLRIRFSSLIINASSLDENKTSIKDFIQDNNINCQTNGKIIVMSEMMSRHPFLSNLAKTHLEPLGLEHYKDFIFLQEPMTMGVEGRGEPFVFDQELEKTLDVPWLSSIVTRQGCFVFKAKIFPIANPHLLDKSKEELLELWNREVKNTGWTSSRGVFLSDLRNVLKSKDIDTSNVSLKQYRRIENDELVVCNDSRQTFKVTFPDGDYKMLSNIHSVKPNELNLNVLHTFKHILYPSEKSCLFQLNDCDKCVEILVLKESVVISSTILIGHVGQEFGQFIFGKEFLIIPVWSNAVRTPNGSLITKQI
jgi:hypothetical protein